MIGCIASIVGERAARPVLFGFLAAMALLILIVVVRCDRDDGARQQAEQTTRSGEAISDAAAEAIGTIENRTVTERDIDRATAVAQLGVENAVDPVDVRRAVLAGVCGQTAHRNDPACAVR